MKPDPTLAHRILEALARTPDCRIEELVYRFPALTWNQVFHEVNCLSRSGQLRLVLDGQGVFTVRKPR
jgi:hypothetical protein